MPAPIDISSDSSESALLPNVAVDVITLPKSVLLFLHGAMVVA